MTDLPSENSSFEFRAVEKVVDESVPRQIHAEKQRRRLRTRSQDFESLLRKPTLGKDSFIQDKESGVLYLRISPSGRSAWYFYKSICGKPVKVKISDTNLMSLQEARIEVIRWLRELNAGIHPRSSRMALKGYDLTLEELGKRYYEQHMQHNSARPDDEYRRLCLYWGPIARKRVAELTTNDLQRWLNSLADKQSGASANRLWNQVRACLRWSERMGHITFERKPWEGVKTFKCHPRSRYLSLEEIQRLKGVLDATHSTNTDVIWLAILTGARKSNVLGAKWEDINLAAGIWRVKAEDDKSESETHKPLTEAALVILTRRRKAHPDAVYVFPSPAGSRSGHLEEIDHWWYRVRAKAGLNDVRIHDLRHTCASYLGMSGASSFTIQRCLGHRSSSTSGRYTHLAIGPTKEALERSQRLMLGCVEPEAVSPAEQDGLHGLKIFNLFVAMLFGLTGFNPRRLATVISRQPLMLPLSDDATAATMIADANIQQNSSDNRLSAAQQIIVESKIVQALLRGAKTKKALYSKIGSQVRVLSKEMARILHELEQRKVIRSYRTEPDLHNLKYALYDRKVPSLGTVESAG